MYAALLWSAYHWDSSTVGLKEAQRLFKYAPAEGRRRPLLRPLAGVTAVTA